MVEEKTNDVYHVLTFLSVADLSPAETVPGFNGRSIWWWPCSAGHVMSGSETPNHVIVCVDMSVDSVEKLALSGSSSEARTLVQRQLLA